ncbi:hypothetical protein IPM09_04105 [Candidatus Saccharibacteria bacterium]|nr:MAG: hypothetical protein IPM09_04105 [Candidatus Saccharibacteria bacterium]
MPYRISAGFSKVAFVLILCCVFVGGAVGSVLLGYGYIGIKQPSQQVRLVADVCDKKIVDQYNAAFDDISKQPARLSQLEKTIVSRSGYRDDSTCLYILTQKSLVDGNTVIATSYLSSLKSNVDKGVYVNTNLRGVSSVEQLEISIKTYQTSTANPPKGEG